jgi:hypothetical protein
MNEPAYIKLSVSFREVLHLLKGAPGVAFMSLAFNEAAIGLGRGKPLSIYDIAERTDQSPRTVARAVQYLVELELAAPVPERGSHGETLYRVTDYVSFSPPTPKGAKARRKG